MDIGKLNTKTSTPWAISLSAFSSGEASFHATPGKAVIGLGGDPKVAQVAQEIIQIAQRLFPQTKPVQELSLPEPGIIQLFFLTTHGLHVVKDHMDQIQKPESPFLELTGRFHFIHAFADQISEERHKPNVKALYAAAFTPEELNRDQLIPLVFAAMTKLKEINPTFDRRIQQLGSLSGVKMFSFKHYPRMYTLTTMQTIMKRVLKSNNVGFNPTPDDDFFVISNTDAQGNEEVFLLYFDIAW